MRWRWQWVTHVGNNAAAFDFVGALESDNRMTGTIKRREIGLSLNFMAKRQIATSGLSETPLAAPTTISRTNIYQVLGLRDDGTPMTQPAAQQPGTQTPATPAPVVTMSSGTRYQPNGSGGMNPESFANRDTFAGPSKFVDPFQQFDQSDVAAAQQQFPNSRAQQLHWLYDQKNTQLDRQQGNSYSIRMR